jgi:hypothetical protein
MLRLVTTRAARHAARAVAPACIAAYQRGYAEGGDIVKEVFLNQQKQFRALLDATKDLEVPVDGDRAAIKAYAEKRKAIMQKVRVETCAVGKGRATRDRDAPDTHVRRGRPILPFSAFFHQRKQVQPRHAVVGL